MQTLFFKNVMVIKKTNKIKKTKSRKKRKKETKLRVNSTGAASEIIAVAKNIISPPKHIDMNETDIINFDCIIDEMAKSDWTNHNVTLACHLAKLLTDVEKQQNILRDEGTVVEGSRGLMANPRVGAIKSYSSSIISLRRTIGLHAISSGMQKKDLGKQKITAKKIESGALTASDDDLINWPQTIN